MGGTDAVGVSRLRILLVSQAFPPFNTSGAVRVGKLANYLTECGHDVRVITASPLPYPRTLPVEIAAERIIRTSSFDPFALFAWLRRKRTRAAAGTSTHSLPGSGRPGRLLRLFGALIAIPDPQVGWYPSAVMAGRRLLRRWRPDAIYASALPFTAHLVAARLAHSARIPWVAEFRDHFADNPYSSLPVWRGPIDRWIERRVVSSASACVTVSEPMAQTLRAFHMKPVVVVLNGFEKQACRLPSPAITDAPLRIVYTGIIYPGRRDPSSLFEAIASLGADGRHIEVDFYGQDLRGVLDAADRNGVSDQVRVLGAVGHDDSLAQQQMADVLLLLLWNDPREAGVYTGKLFEYIGAGRPILAVGARDGVAARLIRERGLGIVASDPSLIASSLRQWIKEKRLTGRVAGPSDAAKTGLSRDEQFVAIDDLLHSILGGAFADTSRATAAPATPTRT